jgi:hypothetical protein
VGGGEQRPAILGLVADDAALRHLEAALERRYGVAAPNIARALAVTTTPVDDGDERPRDLRRG